MPGRRNSPTQQETAAGRRSSVTSRDNSDDQAKTAPSPGASASHRQKRGTTASATRAAPSPGTASPGGAPLLMMRNSERSAAKFCEFLWDIEYNKLLKPDVDKPALRFGTLVHRAMALWYIPGVKRGLHPAKGFAKAYDEELARVQELFGVRDEDGVWVEARDLGVAMMNNYVDEYGTDSDWEVLVTEHPFEVTVYREVRTREWPHSRVEPWFQYVGVLDGVWKHRRKREIWIPDHKTTRGIAGGDSKEGLKGGKLKYLQLDDQAGGYWSFGVEALIEQALMKKNQQLNGMMYNFMRKAMPDERPSKIVGGARVYLNLNGSVSAKQPSPYFLRQQIFRDEYDRNMAKERAAVDFARLQLFRDGQLPISKSPGEFTCPMCWARDICELHETGHDWQSFARETTRTWDPYAEHEIYAGR